MDKQIAAPPEMSTPDTSPDESREPRKKDRSNLIGGLVLAGVALTIGLMSLSGHMYGKYGSWFGPFSNQYAISLPDGYSDYMTPTGQDEGCQVFGGPGILIAEEVENGFVLVRYGRSPYVRAENECSSYDRFVLSLNEWNQIPRELKQYLKRTDDEHRRRAAERRFRL
ncbi:MAG: hypothetical protein U9Q03_01305 [Patescibacteria group bacterium]|nr:hypothetical protein [Patescibacteria group bacterium]